MSEYTVDVWAFSSVFKLLAELGLVKIWLLLQFRFAVSKWAQVTFQAATWLEQKKSKEQGINNELWSAIEYYSMYVWVYSKIDAHFSFFEVNKRLRILHKTMSRSKLPGLSLSVIIYWNKWCCVVVIRNVEIIIVLFFIIIHSIYVINGLAICRIQYLLSTINVIVIIIIIPISLILLIYLILQVIIIINKLRISAIIIDVITIIYII